MKQLTSFEETIGKTITDTKEHCGTRCITFGDSYIIFYARPLYEDYIIEIEATPDLETLHTFGLVSDEEYTGWLEQADLFLAEVRKQNDLKQLSELKAKYERT